MAAPQKIKTPLTELFNIKVRSCGALLPLLKIVSLIIPLVVQTPIMLAGMNVAAGPELAAAVTNAGGIGVIGGVG